MEEQVQLAAADKSMKEKMLQTTGAVLYQPEPIKPMTNEEYAKSGIHNETEILYLELLQGTRIPVTPFEKELMKQIEESRAAGIMSDIPHDF